MILNIYIRRVNSSGLLVFDIADPANPRFVRRCEPSGIDDMVIDGERIYFYQNRSFRAFDLTTPNRPRLLEESWAPPSQRTYRTYDLKVKDNKAYLSLNEYNFGDYRNVFWVLDVTNWNDIQQISRQERLYRKFTIENNYFIYSSVTDYININNIDLDTGDMDRITSFRTPGEVRDFEIKDNHLILANSTSLLIYDCRDVLDAPDYNDIVPPVSFSLHPAYPNPFNSTTMVGYSIPSPMRVTLTVHDLQGRKVFTCFDGFRLAGEYNQALSMEGMASGGYVVKFNSGKYEMNRSITFCK